MKIVVALSAYNEAKNLKEVIPAIVNQGYTCILVDDGSWDGTAALAESLGAKVVHHAINLGQGWGVLTGFKAALMEDCDLIIEMDADGQHDPAEIPNFLEKMKTANLDILVGSRILGANHPNAPFFRKTFLPLFTSIINRLTGYQLTDSMCGFRAFRKESLLKVFPVLDSILEPQYLAAEMFLRFARAGLTVGEIPITLAGQAQRAFVQGLGALWFRGAQGHFKDHGRPQLQEAEKVMKITTITILFAVIAILETGRTFYRLKKDLIGLRSALVWILMWLAILVFSLFPHLLDQLMRVAQMQNRMFFLLVIAVFILYALVFNLTSRLDNMRRDLAKAIQALSLLGYQKDQTPADQSDED